MLTIAARADAELPVEVWRAGEGAIGLTLPQDLSQGMLAAYLKPYDHIPVWHFK